MQDSEGELIRDLLRLVNTPLLEVQEVIFEIKEVLNKSEIAEDKIEAERLMEIDFQSAENVKELTAEHQKYRDFVHNEFQNLVMDLRKNSEYDASYIIKHLIYAIHASKKDNKDYWADKLNQFL